LFSLLPNIFLMLLQDQVGMVKRTLLTSSSPWDYFCLKPADISTGDSHFGAWRSSPRSLLLQPRGPRGRGWPCTSGVGGGGNVQIPTSAQGCLTSLFPSPGSAWHHPLLGIGWVMLQVETVSVSAGSSHVTQLLLAFISGTTW